MLKVTSVTFFLLSVSDLWDSYTGLIGVAVVAFIATGEISAFTPLVKIMIVAGSAGIVTTSAGAALYTDKRNYKSSKGWVFSVRDAR